MCFGNVLKLKVTKGKLDISIRLEMADDYQQGGGLAEPPPPPSPPASFRVRSSPAQGCQMSWGIGLKE